MFTGSELECLVCGPRDFTIDSLKKNIRSIVDPEILEWLYQVSFHYLLISNLIILIFFYISQILDSETPKFRGDFLQFVSGQRRVPSGDWPVKITVEVRFSVLFPF